MKKAVIFVVLAMVLIGSCAAQSTNDAQRIVGKWTNISSDLLISVLVFNANGTGTMTRNNVENINFNWGISANGDIFISSIGEKKLYWSTDGRRMSFSGVGTFQKS
jgi:hypothetical protein